VSVHFRQVDSDVGTLFVGGIYAIFIILGLLSECLRHAI